MNLSRLLLKMAGWTVNITVPDYPKCIICVAPHTSNWDFVIGKLAYASVGRKAGFLMKESWFFFPMGCIFRAIGGIPVPRRRRTGKSLVESVIEKFDSSTRMAIAITPEGTRKRTAEWHTGFLRMAYGAHVPILIGILSFADKHVEMSEVFEPTGDIEADMRTVKNLYRGAQGKFPDRFTTD